MTTLQALPPGLTRIQFGPSIKSRLTPSLREKRLEFVLSVFKSIKERGTKRNDPHSLDKQRVIELIQTRERDLREQGLSWNMDFNFFFNLLDRNHPIATIFLANYAYDIFDVLAQIHRTDPTMSPPQLINGDQIDLIEANVQGELRGRLKPDEIKGFVKLAKKVLGV